MMNYELNIQAFFYCDPCLHTSCLRVAPSGYAEMRHQRDSASKLCNLDLIQIRAISS